MCSWMEHVCFWKINNQDYFLQQDNQSLPYIFRYYSNLLEDAPIKLKQAIATARNRSGKQSRKQSRQEDGTSRCIRDNTFPNGYSSASRLIPSLRTTANEELRIFHSSFSTNHSQLNNVQQGEAVLSGNLWQMVGAGYH